MWRSGASEAIGRFLPPSCKNLQRACRPQTVIKLPKKKYTPKQDVQLGTEAASEVRNYEKQADLLGAQIMARAGYDPRALAHAPSRSASIRLNKTATWFQMALFWSTNPV